MRTADSKDPSGIGILPLRDSRRIPVHLKKNLLAAEVSDVLLPPAGYGTTALVPGSIGDLGGGFGWPHRPGGGRDFPSWRFAWPVRSLKPERDNGAGDGAAAALSPAGAPQRVNLAPGHGQKRLEDEKVRQDRVLEGQAARCPIGRSDQPQQFLPAFDDSFEPDDRYIPRVFHSAANVPRGEQEERSPGTMTVHPPGTLGIGLAGSIDAEQIGLFFPVESRLVSQNSKNNDPRAGSLVWDLKDNEFEYKPERTARLQSAWKIVQAPMTPIGNWNLHPGGAGVGAKPGEGAAVLALQLYNSECDDTTGGYCFDREAVGPDHPQVDPRVEGIVGAIYGGTRGRPRPGPWTLGTQSGSEKHVAGTDAEGRGIVPVHYDLDKTMFVKDLKDGPLKFDGDFEPPIESGPGQNEVRFLFDPDLRYSWGGRQLQGKYRWVSTGQMDDDDPGFLPPLIPLPSEGSPPFPLPRDPFPFPFPPGGFPGGEPFPLPPDVFIGPGGRFAPQPNVIVQHRPAPRIRVNAKIERNQTDINFARGRDLDAAPLVGSRVDRHMTYSSREMCLPGLVVRPQFLLDDRIDFRNWKLPSRDLYRLQKVETPVACRLEGWSKQLSDGWGYTVGFDRPRSAGRYPIPSATGGICLTPAELGVEDVRDGGYSVAAADLSKAYLAIAPFTRLAFGIPDTDTGEMKAGSIVFRVPDAATLTSGGEVLVDRVGSTGVLENVLKILGNGDIFLKDVDTAPSVNPVAGVKLFSENGESKVRGPQGTVTTLAPA